MFASGMPLIAKRQPQISNLSEITIQHRLFHYVYLYTLFIACGTQIQWLETVYQVEQNKSVFYFVCICRSVSVC